MSFYIQLKKLINQFDLSLNQVERDLNYPRNSLSNYRHVNVPKVKLILELSAYFYVPIGFFFEGEEKQWEFVYIKNINELTMIQKIKQEMREKNIWLIELADHLGIEPSELSGYLFSSKNKLDEEFNIKIWKKIKEMEER